MQATTGVVILNFEQGNGFPAATAALTGSGTAFQTINTLSPFAISNAVSSITTTSGYSIGVQYCAFDDQYNLLNAPDSTQGVFLVADRSANDTMISGTQGLVAGKVNINELCQTSAVGGAYLTFDRNLSQFGVCLNTNSLSTIDIVCLFDSEGVLMAKYKVGIAAGKATFFGVKSPNSLIRSVWIGQSCDTNGQVFDDISFVPAPAPATSITYSFAGSSGTNGWAHTTGATLTTATDHLIISGTNCDSKIYRSITLPAGSYTVAGSGSGATMVSLATSWSAPKSLSLNLSGTADWYQDHRSFTTSGTSFNLVVQVNTTPGEADIQSLSITSMTPTPYSPNVSALQTTKSTLGTVRGMDATESYTGPLGSAYFTELKNWGCNVVRLQCHPVTYANAVHEDFWTAWPTYLSWIIQNVQEAQNAGLLAVIDLHEIPFADTDSIKLPPNETNWNRPDLGQRFAEVWLDIVSSIVSNNLTSAVYGYELTNEPLDDTQRPNQPRQWWPLAANTINMIRTVDANTWIIFDVGPGGDFSGFTSPMPLVPLPDPANKVIYSAHFYYPTDFCMQGLSGYPLPVSYTSGTAGTAMLASYLAPADTFSAQWPVPIFIGEFSTLRWGPDQDTANWLCDLISLFESRGWSWNYHAWQEYQGWRLDMDNTYNPDPSASIPVQSDNNKTKRGQVIYNALLNNN
jgi:hypothetical protein